MWAKNRVTENRNTLGWLRHADPRRLLHGRRVAGVVERQRPGGVDRLLQLGRAVAAQVHQALLAEQHLERLQRRLPGVELVDDERRARA